MVYLTLSNNALILDISERRDLLDWEHRTFFNIVCGYSLDERRGVYSFSHSSEIDEILRDTVDYLRHQDIHIETDSSIEQRLLKYAQSMEDFQHALKVIEDDGLASQPNLELPAQFRRQLEPYQVRCVQHLLSVKHGANFSVPGSGKTSMVYAAYAQLQQEGVVEKLLVIGPRSSFMPWEEEFEGCFARSPNSVRFTGSRDSRQGLYLNASNYELWICTYQTAANDIEQLIALCTKFKTFIVIDESHNIKKLEGGVWANTVLRLAPYGVRRAVLSGTPMPNSYADLWTQITFLWPDKQVLGERTPYRYMTEDETQYETIQRAVNPFFVRVKKSELNLPRVSFNRIMCDLMPYQANIYRALSVRFLRELSYPPEDGPTLRQWRKAKIVRLIQAASNPSLLSQFSEEFEIPPLQGEGASILQLIDQYPRYEISSKFSIVADLVGKITSDGDKVIVWTSFVHNIRMLENTLKDFELYILYGAVPKDEREDVEFNREQQLQSFKMTTQPAVLIANPAACAESISLQKVCHHAIYLERTFNCGQYLQSLDRIHRIGMPSGQIATYHLLIAHNTIDETIDRRLIEKERNMMNLLGDDLPVGSLESDLYELGQSEDEEQIDFDESFDDLRKLMS